MHLAGSTGSAAVFAFLYLIWDTLLGGTTPVLLSLISAAADRQGAVQGVAQASQQGASAGGISRGHPVLWTPSRFPARRHALRGFIFVGARHLA